MDTPDDILAQAHEFDCANHTCERCEDPIEHVSTGRKECEQFDEEQRLCESCKEAIELCQPDCPALADAKADHTKDQLCAECGESVAPGSGRCVNRVPILDEYADRVEQGRPFPEGLFVCVECDAAHD